MKPILSTTFATLGMIAYAGSLSAAPIILAGKHFSVSYDDALVGVYKAGQISGSLDTVYFQPNAFSVFSVGSPASQQAGLELSFTIDPGHVLTGLSFNERGDYFLSAGGAAQVNARLTATNSATLQSVVLDFLPSAPLTQVGGSTLWDVTGGLSPSALGGPQTFTLNLGTTLFSQPSTGGLGFAQTTYLGFTVVTAAVPEPQTGALLLGGLAAWILAARGRRSRAVARGNENHE